MRPFIRNHYLPQWLHRITCGAFAAACLALLGSNSVGEPSDSWRHIVSLALIIASIPVGIVCACVAHRFSIVEGLAGDAGYEDLDENRDENRN
jgi:hypothetical protein